MTGNEWENQAVFDFQGNALRGIKAFNYSNLTNLLQNNSFEWDGYTESPSAWQIWKNGQSSAIKTESYDNTRYKLSFWSDKAYESSIYQTVGKLSSGTYKLSIDAMGDTSLETAELYIKNYGGNEQKFLSKTQVLGKLIPLITFKSQMDNAKLAFTSNHQPTNG